MKWKTLIDVPSISEEGLEILKTKSEITKVPFNDRNALLSEIKDIDCIITRRLNINKSVLEKAFNLKVIGQYGIGLDKIDVANATKLNIQVINTHNITAISVAEHTVALIFAFSKKLIELNNIVKSNLWSQKREKLFGTELRGKNIGLVGLGNIARQVGEYCNALNMNVLGYDPYIEKCVVEYPLKKINSLNTMLPQCNIVSLHVPLTKETEGFFNKKYIDLMQPNSVLINTSRGKVIDEKYLIEALKNKKIMGAALDVLEQEPPKNNNLLLTMDNVIITPHFAGRTYEAFTNASVNLVENTISLFEKGECEKNAKVNLI